MYFPILNNWKSKFPILCLLGGIFKFPILCLLGGIFHFNSNFKGNFCMQTVENLIRRRILRRLTWFCTVCRCATKRTICLYRLIAVEHMIESGDGGDFKPIIGYVLLLITDTSYSLLWLFIFSLSLIENTNHTHIICDQA